MIHIKKLATQFKDIFFYKVLEKSLEDCTTVLDVGCGSNSPIQNVKKTLYSEGIDIHRRSILESKRGEIHNKYKIANILDINKYYQPKSYDAVIALDVIEHFEKRTAIQLLHKMEKIAKKKIIMLTPNGHIHQVPYDDNPYQEHKSGWITSDFEKRNYTVYGLRSFRFIRGNHADIKLKPWLLWGLIAFITEPLLYRFPNLSFDLFAVKTLKGN